jgi:hypothetical protein
MRKYRSCHVVKEILSLELGFLAVYDLYRRTSEVLRLHEWQRIGFNEILDLVWNGFCRRYEVTWIL